MTRSRALLTILLLGGFALEEATAQSLGQLARKEEERRKQIPSGRQYTNADLRPVERANVPAVAAADPGVGAGSADAAGRSPVKAPGENETDPPRGREKRDETHWRTRAREVRGRVEQAQAEIAPLEARLSDLEAQAGTSPAASRERDVTATHLHKVRQNLQFFVAEVERFEQRARENNVPADWIR